MQRIHRGVMRAMRELQPPCEKQILADISIVMPTEDSVRGDGGRCTWTDVIGGTASTIDAMLVARRCRRPPMRRVKERLARRAPGTVVMNCSLRW